MTGHFLLKPISKVGNDTVRMYDFIRYTFSDKQFILERMAENVAFNRLVKEVNVTVSDTEIQTELNALENKTDISYKTCQKSILQQKVIEKYASEIKVTAENARQYYEELTKDTGRAADCVACGQCENVCPQHLPVIELLRECSEKLDG